MSEKKPVYRVGVDVGGTFIDGDDRDLSCPVPPVHEIDGLANSGSPMPIRNALRLVDVGHDGLCTVDS